MLNPKKFVNTQYFREAALEFKKNKGRYTLAPVNSREWWEYWQEQERRCLNGFTVGGMQITGRHYFYMNFTPIKAIDDPHSAKNVQHRGARNKVVRFPAFWEVDYDWWWAKQIAWGGMAADMVTQLDIPAIGVRDYIGGQHLSCVKTRRAGFSYKEAADGSYNYNFIPKSKSFFLASHKDYLIKDGILNKVTDDLNWLNTRTDDFWRKNRQENNTLMMRKASYYDKKGNNRGYHSEIVGKIMDNPNKARGIDGLKITFEEAGSFKNLKQALEIVLGSVQEGGYTTGQVSVFGTGGEEGPAIEGLEDVFLYPSAWNMLEFNNIYEEGYEDTYSGYFVPCFKTYTKFMDADGNIDMPGAMLFDDGEREKKKLSKDAKGLDRRRAEFPRKPSEALIRMNVNPFPISDIDEQLLFVRKNKALKSFIKHGYFVHHPEFGVQFKLDPEAKPILHYPHNKADDLTGATTIYNEPYKNKDELIPHRLYYVVVDPFYMDDAEDVTSLGAVYVVMAENNVADEKGDKIVASYVGRPKLEDFYRVIFDLAEYYNATIQSEMPGGGKGILDYAKYHNLLGRLEFEPEFINAKEINKGNANRSYFLNMPTETKRMGLNWYISWLKKPRGFDENGNSIYNLRQIYDEALLLEMRKYSPSRNVDRISAMIVAMFTLKEHLHIGGAQQQKPQEANAFFNRPLFAAESNSSEYMSIGDTSGGGWLNVNSI